MGDGAETKGLEAYWGVARELADQSIDLALVDGCIREICMLEVIPKIKPGGMIVFDNANWFLPSDTRTPNSVSNGSEPPLAEMIKVQQLLKTWQLVRTSDGINETWLWFAPA